MSEMLWCWRCGEPIAPGGKFDLIRMLGRNVTVHAAGACER